MKVLFYSLSIFATLALTACSNTSQNKRNLSSDKDVYITSEVLSTQAFEKPLKIHLNKRYIGTFGNIAELKNCSGAIHIWFYRSSGGSLHYYSEPFQQQGSDCSFLRKNLVDASRALGQKCTGVDFDPENVDQTDLSYLRTLNIKGKKILIPRCDDVQVTDSKKTVSIDLTDMRNDPENDKTLYMNIRKDTKLTKILPFLKIEKNYRVTLDPSK